MVTPVLGPDAFVYAFQAHTIAGEDVIAECRVQVGVWVRAAARCAGWSPGAQSGPARRSPANILASTNRTCDFISSGEPD
jgi:hypothetical protein